MNLLGKRKEFKIFSLGLNFLKIDIPYKWLLQEKKEKRKLYHLLSRDIEVQTNSKLPGMNKMAFLKIYGYYSYLKKPEEEKHLIIGW